MTEIVDIEVIDVNEFNKLVISVIECINVRRKSLEKERVLKELKTLKNEYVSKRSLYITDLMI